MRDDLGSVRFRELAAIEYHGLSGISKSCLNAIRRLLQYGDLPERALLITANQAHAFLLSSEVLGQIAIKSGFSSGYGGEGPNALADALCALLAANVEIDEVEVEPELLARLELSALTLADLDSINSLPPVRPASFYRYIYDLPEPEKREQTAWQSFHQVMPWHVIDERLNDLATKFFESPDRVIMDGFRRLEDLVRERIKSVEHGAKLFSIAFGGDDSALMWVRVPRERWTADEPANVPPEALDKSEQAGRMQLFTGAYQAFRNPRAHRVMASTGPDELAEFLMLNQLFLLEAAACERPNGHAAPRLPCGPRLPD